MNDRVSVNAPLEARGAAASRSKPLLGDEGEK